MPYRPQNKSGYVANQKRYQKNTRFQRPKYSKKKATTLTGFKSKKWNPKSRTLVIRY